MLLEHQFDTMTKDAEAVAIEVAHRSEPVNCHRINLCVKRYVMATAI
jgi:hypothetical protein